MYKVIVTDMDGTLLNDDKNISENNKKSIIASQKSGVKFVLASGRPINAMIDYAKILEMDKYEGYIIAYSGAEIIDVKTREVLYSNSLNKDQIEYIYELSKKYDVTFISYIDNKIYTNRVDEYAHLEASYTKMPFHTVKDKSELENALVIKYVFDPKVITKIYGDIKSDVEKMGIDIAISNPYFLEFVDVKSNKGYAVEKLCKKLDISLSELIACGDSLNDLPMLKKAGLPVCAKNSSEEIIEVSSYISVDNNQGILDDVIRKYIF